MRVDLWQIPVLVMAGIVILEFAGWLLLRRTKMPGWAVNVRILVHIGLAAGVTALLLLAFFVVGNSVLTLASLVLDIVAVWLAYQSIQQRKKQEANRPPAESS